jgi:hypothetical protein
MERRTGVFALRHGFVVTATKTGRGGTASVLKSAIVRVSLSGFLGRW